MNADNEIDFHPSAAENFRERGQRLLLAMKPLQAEKGNERFQADRHPAAIFTEEDISHLGPQQTVNSLTMEVSAITFYNGEKPVVLEKDECIEIDRLSEAIQKTPDFRPRISRKFVRDEITNWLEARVSGGISEDLPLYVLGKARSATHVFEVWVPLASLAVEHEVRFGPVRVKPISRETLDIWFENVRKGKSMEDLAILDNALERERREVQGLAAACVTLRAERQFAVDKALEKAEEVAALFRLFHPANTDPRAAFYCRTLGRENLEKYSAFVVRDEAFQGRTAHMIPPYPDIWALGVEQLSQLREDFSLAERLLVIGQRSAFQQEVLDAILLYTRSTMVREPTDKVVFIFSALESILLKNELEPIQTHVGDRLAFVLGGSVQERKDIARLTRACYGFRSKFLHHGRTLDDYVVLGKFMEYVWIFFIHLVKVSHQFEARADFLEEIETKKYSVP